MFVPIEPIGSNRGQPRNFFRNSTQDYGESIHSNRNLLPEFAHRYAAKPHSDTKNTNEEDADPEWYSHGPSSQNDCIELSGFPGHVSQENRCNISGGPTSGNSSNNGSPPAKSTPAKVTPTTLNGKGYSMLQQFAKNQPET